MRIIALLFTLAVVAVPTAARADHHKQVRYLGIHPVAKAEGGGFCYIEGPHVHVYAADKLQYRDHRGYHHFVGDPVAYGYDGPKFVYRGHHPIHVDVVVGDATPDVEFCYLDGPHYHCFAPAAGPEFKVVGDAYFFVGEPPRAYVEARAAMIEINAVYTPIVYARPVITVDAPVGWIGARAEFIAPAVVVVPPPPPRPRAAVGIDARIVVPVPSVRVDIRGGIGIGGGVRIGGGKRGHR